MVVFINGSFGVGKTTVARLLRGALPGSAVYDPELFGIFLMRLAERASLKRPAAANFQDLRLWRRSADAGVRLFRALSRGPVIVPMTFSRRGYFDEVVAGVRRFDTGVPGLLPEGQPADREETSGRARGRVGGPGADWRARRDAGRAEAHRDPHFGEPVETEDRPAREVGADIFRRLK